MAAQKDEESWTCPSRLSHPQARHLTPILFISHWLPEVVTNQSRLPLSVFGSLALLRSLLCCSLVWENTWNSSLPNSTGSLQASENLKLLAYLLARFLFLVRYCHGRTSAVGLLSRATKWLTLGYIFSKPRRKGVSNGNKWFLLTGICWMCKTSVLLPDCVRLLF